MPRELALGDALVPGLPLLALRRERLTHHLPEEVDRCIARAIGALGRFYERPDKAGYARARDAVASAIDRASDASDALPLLDHLHLIRLALLDGESAIADYMPETSATRESIHAS